MPYRDLRAFLDRLEAEGELARVEVEVDTKYEISAICRKVSDAHGPVLLFENPKGYGIPIAVKLLSSRKRCAMALETSPENLTDEWLNRLRKGPVKPRLVNKGPCKENIITGEGVDLWKFPIPLWNEKDGGHFITAPIVISKDPESEWRNAAVYRMMIHDRKTTGLMANLPYRHLYLQYKKAEVKDEPFPVAVAIGVDPVVFCAAVAPIPYGVDEIAMAGALRGAPIEMVKCETIPLEVPATAEIVLEGEVRPKVRRLDGPFGEFTGYYGPRVQTLIFEVKAITHRDDPIYHACYTGRPIVENHLLNSISMEAEIMRTCPLPGLRKVHVKESGCSFICVAQIEKRYDGHSKWLGTSILGTGAARMIKYLILVDTDIEPFDPSQVDWAIATRSQPSKDTVIIPDVAGVSADPSLPMEAKRMELTSKMLIDATKPTSLPFPETPLAPAEIVRKVEADWPKYGIKLSA